MNPSPKVIFISTHNGKDNYLFEMATSMAAYDRQVDYILIKNSNEPIPNAPFKPQVIGKPFKWFLFQTTWVYFKILWHTLFNISSSCVYIMDDMLLVPVFKFLGNKTAYYTETSKHNSVLDAIIGNVFLSQADLILIPSQREKLRFEKIAIVDPAEASTGVEALTHLIYKERPKSIATFIITGEDDAKNQSQGEIRASSDTESAEGPQAEEIVSVDVHEEKTSEGIQEEEPKKGNGKLEVIKEEESVSDTEIKPEEIRRDSMLSEIDNNVLMSVEEASASIEGERMGTSRVIKQLSDDERQLNEQVDIVYPSEVGGMDDPASMFVALNDRFAAPTNNDEALLFAERERALRMQEEDAASDISYTLD